MNRLENETSPYLLQHADNPVDWYPWGEEAFAKAKAENKPILLSIGYAACHWCHVMAHESFEDDETAAIMNHYFVNVKVDREERPDIDQIYMSAVVALTQQGGWPLTAMLTPEGKPFFGGTYFPKEQIEGMGMPSFQQVLFSIARTWDTDADKIIKSADSITAVISQGLGSGGSGENDSEAKPTLTKEDLYQAASLMGNRFDPKWGGFEGAPKFPQPMNLEFLLRVYLETGDGNLLHMVNHTLEMMARGGMYDHIGGGFARYSTDEQWLVPHFEKMLYDNAQLARVYLHAYQITGRPFFKKVVQETLDYVLREMTHPDGGFYSSQDADSEGEEGKFYVWTLAEIQPILGEDLFPVSVYYDITMHGNWEGKNIPNMVRSHEEAADMLKIDPIDLYMLIEKAKKSLYAIRSERVWPGLDDKILTSWNGLMLTAFAEAGRVLDRPDYTAAAVKNGQFLYRTMRQEDGRLLRTWKATAEDGSGDAKYNGYLEDYAFLGEGLLALYQTTFDEQWYVWAEELSDLILNHFQDEENWGFFDTSDDHETLIYRPKDVQDNALPSGNAAAVDFFLKLYLLSGKSVLRTAADKGMQAMGELLLQYPNGFGNWLGAAATGFAESKEIAIVGDPTTAETRNLIDQARQGYRPHDVVALKPDPEKESRLPLLSGKGLVNQRPAAYVCRRFACQNPVTTPTELADMLSA